jgi:hypothetical protein
MHACHSSAMGTRDSIRAFNCVGALIESRLFSVCLVSRLRVFQSEPEKTIAAAQTLIANEYRLIGPAAAIVY